jgi:hypothetical protein
MTCEHPYISLRRVDLSGGDGLQGTELLSSVTVSIIMQWCPLDTW